MAVPDEEAKEETEEAVSAVLPAPLDEREVAKARNAVRAEQGKKKDARTALVVVAAADEEGTGEEKKDMRERGVSAACVGGLRT